MPVRLGFRPAPELIVIKRPCPLDCMLGNAAVMVVACIEDQGELYVAGDECRYLERISEHAATYKLLGVTRVWRMELIKLVAAWKVAGDSVEIIGP